MEDDNMIVSISEKDFMELWDFLVQGKVPASMVIVGWEPLSPRQAMKVVYLLQERMGVVSDEYELCASCQNPFSTHYESYEATDKGFWCSDCLYE